MPVFLLRKATMNSTEELELVKLVFNTPSDEGFADFAVIGKKDFDLIKEGLIKSGTFTYRIALTTEMTEQNGVYIVAREADPRGHIGYASLSDIRNCYLVESNVLIDHNGFISKK